jgi:hypothetical protein
MSDNYCRHCTALLFDNLSKQDFHRTQSWHFVGHHKSRQYSLSFSKEGSVSTTSFLPDSRINPSSTYAKLHATTDTVDFPRPPVHQNIPLTARKPRRCPGSYLSRYCRPQPRRRQAAHRFGGIKLPIDNSGDSPFPRILNVLAMTICNVVSTIVISEQRVIHLT